MRHLIIASGLAALLAWDAQAQNTNLAFIPGKLAVYRGGDGLLTISKDRCHPAFIDEYDPAAPSQATPMMSFELPTNGPNNGNNCMWLNAHAGSEGQGLTRSADRRYLTMTGYSGVIGSIAGLTGTPSSATNSAGQGYNRGFGLIDAYTNFNVVYSGADWFGIEPGITQNNPRGIATDGSNNFWGCGTVAGVQSGGSFVETGTLYSDGGLPLQVQNLVNSAYSMKIVNNVLYMVCQTGSGGAYNNGVYDFVDFSGTVVPLDYAPGNEAKVLNTNLFLNFGSYGNILCFDMNRQGTIAYAADETFGIVKFVNSGGTWSSPYYFNSNNIGSTSATVNPKGATGCFGIAVDFSQANPVIYATTTDEGDGANICSNRLITLTDYGTNPISTTLYATTLAVAGGINECFRGVDFTPDLTPLITLQPSSASVTTNETAVFDAAAASPFTLTYQWQDNGTNVLDSASISGATSNILTIAASKVTNSGNYTLIVSNQYGAVTSQVANLAVSAIALPPVITNAVAHVTNFIGNNQSFSVDVAGTPAFTYQWYFGTTPLVNDGVKYFGATNATLYVTNLALSDSGSYYITVSNQAGGVSNLAAVLTVQYVLPAIPPTGQPSSVTLLQGETATLVVSSVIGTQPLAYQWYQNSFTDPLSNENEFSGAETNTLTITDVTTADADLYFCAISNAGGGVITQPASVTVIVPPALSFVAYSNQIYFQNFDSLPDPGTAVVNTIGGGGPTTIGGVTYDIANPFDFAFPLYTNITAQPSGGLGLAATMPGWYGECDGDYAPGDGGQLGATDGSTTTGGVYSFGLTNSLAVSSNRALGLIATSTSAGAHFGLKLINETSTNLNYISMQFVGEFWKTGTKPKTMVFGYNVDPAGNGSSLTTNEILAASNNPVASLTFSFPTAGVVGGTNGTLPGNQKNLAVTNLALASPWTPGSALWLVWSINDATGSGQGYGIDNLSFAAGSSPNVSLTPIPTAPLLGGVAYTASGGLVFTFTNAPGASAQFTVFGTTDLTLPFSQWTNLGNPTEVSPGNYQFTDALATNSAQKFYTVTIP